MKQTEIGEGEIKYPPLIPLIFFLNKRESHMSFFFFFLMPTLEKFLSDLRNSSTWQYDQVLQNAVRF